MGDVKKCVCCGKVFTTDNKIRILCSTECQRKRKQEQTKKSNIKRDFKVYYKPVISKCRVCGLPNPYKQVARHYHNQCIIDSAIECLKQHKNEHYLHRRYREIDRCYKMLGMTLKDLKRELKKRENTYM